MSDMGKQETGRPDGRHGVVVVGAGHTGQDVARRVVHVMSVTLIEKELPEGELQEGLTDARYIRGDGTSGLVLKEAGIDACYAFIATTRNDDVNLEASRLAVKARVPEVLCRLRDPSRVHEAVALGARAVSAPEAMASAIVSRIPGVVVTTSQVGLGQGDILQVLVLPGSPVVGNQIKDIATRAYLIAAIYRDGHLVIPHGDTVINAGDQVLLVGEPETLGAVASYFRLGGAQFPRQFGRTVMLWAPPDDATTTEEARWLREVTSTASFMRVALPDEPAGTSEPWPVHLLADGMRGDGSATPQALSPLLKVQPGIYVLPPPKRGLLKERGMASVRSLLDVAHAPLLIARGTHPYSRILVAVADSASSWRGLELAFDIARLLGSRVTAVHVSPPRFIGGDRAEETAKKVQARVNELARLFEVDLECLLMEGNPVREVQKLAEDHELLVVARGRGQSNSYLQPDIGLRMVLGCPCSAILLTRD
ncbi:MAG: NAD-binding protein [Deltaproteobacteria bacterium]|nr:NAD-binding protein [Deltaproteobacteria bacterium]